MPRAPRAWTTRVTFGVDDDDLRAFTATERLGRRRSGTVLGGEEKVDVDLARTRFRLLGETGANQMFERGGEVGPRARTGGVLNRAFRTETLSLFVTLTCCSDLRNDCGALV